MIALLDVGGFLTKHYRRSVTLGVFQFPFSIQRFEYYSAMYSFRRCYKMKEKEMKHWICI
jgi:hypothetical protein